MEHLINFQVTVDDNTQLSCVKYYLDGRLEEQFSEDEIEEAERLLELQTGASDEYQDDSHCCRR